MAHTRIVCPTCTVTLSRARLDIVAKWFACQTLEPEDWVGTYYKLFFFFRFLFSPCNAKLLHTSNMELYK